MAEDKEFVPKTCDECIKSKYKLPKPACSHEHGLDHKRSYEYFKNIYNVELPQHLEAMALLKQQKEQCLEQIQVQAMKMVQLRKMLNIDDILGKIGELSTKVCDIETNGGSIKSSEDDRILASPQKKVGQESVTKKVIRHESAPILKEHRHDEKIEGNENNNKEALPLKDRGWLMYIRNCKKDKLQDYTDALKAEHPDLTENQIKISVNAAGNYMIRYTLNPELA
jgi:hypothetical protein